MGAPANGVYSFQNVSLGLVGPGIALNLTGIAGEGYEVAMDGDKGTLVWGADGSGMHSMSQKQGGTLTIRTLKTSAINKALSAMYSYQTTDASLYGQNTLTLRDKLSKDTITATGAGIRKFPNLTFAVEGNTNEWIFNCTYIDEQLGDGGVTNLVVNG